jgi:hypothetical protein
MTALYLEALAAIAISLSVLMAGAWLLQQRTGNSGWVDTIWTFSLGLVAIFLQNQELALSIGYFCGWATLLAPVFMYWILGHCDRHPAAGGADAALARRPLPRLSVPYQ